MLKKSILTLLLLGVTMTMFGQTYTITEQELSQLEATIETQRNLLTEQAEDLTALRNEIEQAKKALTKLSASFAEYESAALLIQKNLQAELATKRNQLKGWQIALPITGAALVTGGLLIGIFAK